MNISLVYIYIYIQFQICMLIITLGRIERQFITIVSKCFSCFDLFREGLKNHTHTYKCIQICTWIIHTRLLYTIYIYHIITCIYQISICWDVLGIVSGRKHSIVEAYFKLSADTAGIAKVFRFLLCLIRLDPVYSLRSTCSFHILLLRCAMQFVKCFCFGILLLVFKTYRI